jgi:hypothetical protein
MDQIVPLTSAQGSLRTLDEVSPKLEATIFDYRCKRLPLEEMWTAVAMTSEGIVNYIAHTEANSVGAESALEGNEHRAARLLEPVWHPLFSTVAHSATLPAQEEWAADRSQLLEVGRAGFTETWRRLGLAARPEGASFYLSVFDPEDAATE